MLTKIEICSIWYYFTVSKTFVFNKISILSIFLFFKFEINSKNFNKIQNENSLDRVLFYIQSKTCNLIKHVDIVIND